MDNEIKYCPKCGNELIEIQGYGLCDRCHTPWPLDKLTEIEMGLKFAYVKEKMLEGAE